MLYQLHQMQQQLAAPWRLAAQSTLDWSQHAANPFREWPMADWAAATSELVVRLTQEYPKQGFGLTEATVKGKTYAMAEQVVLDTPFCELRRFVKVGLKTAQPKVLLVAPLSGHYSTLLRDTVRAFSQDFDVYITDWRNARDVPLEAGAFHFDDYVALVIQCLHALGDGAAVVSVCQPTVPVLCAISLMAARKDKRIPRAMIMMGGPIDTRQNPSEVNGYAKAHSIEWFQQNVITQVPANYPGAGRRVYPGFLQYYGFVAMNPDRHMKAHWNFFGDLVVGDGEGAEHHRKFYDEYNAVMDLPAEYYLETVERVFQRTLLPKGEMVVAGERVDPSAIRTTALMTVEGELDDISCPGQTEAAHGLCSNIPTARRDHLLMPGVGHYGIFSGRRFREAIYPKLHAFLQKH